MRRCVRSASAFCFTMSPAITIHVEVLLPMLIVSFFCCCLLCSSPSPSLSSSPRPPPLPRSRGSNGTWILRQLVVRLTCGWLSPWCLSLLRLASRTAASLRDPGREELRRRDERLPRGVRHPFKARCRGGSTGFSQKNGLADPLRSPHPQKGCF